MKPDVESSADRRDAGGLPQDSGGGRDEQTSQEGAPMHGLAEMVAEAVEEAVERRFQSAKDKRWAELERKYRAVHAAEGEAPGPVAQRAAAEGEAPGPVVAVEAGGTEGAAGLGEKIRSLAGLPGLRANEEAAALLLRHKDAGDLDGYLVLVEGLLALALGDAPEGDKPAISAATAVTPGGSSPPDDLAQAYQRRKSAIRAGDVNALTALKREFRQKGLEIF